MALQDGPWLDGVCCGQVVGLGDVRFSAHTLPEVQTVAKIREVGRMKGCRNSPVLKSTVECYERRSSFEETCTEASTNGLIGSRLGVQTRCSSAICDDSGGTAHEVGDVSLDCREGRTLDTSGPEATGHVPERVERHRISLEACLSEDLSRRAGSGRSLRAGVTLEDLVQTVGKHGVEHWRIDLSEVGELHAASKLALKSLPPWDRRHDLEQVRIYVDGSHFNVQQTAWAAVAVGRISDCWYWIGFVSGRVFPAGHEACLGMGECNAHTAELHAMVHALCATCAMDCIDVEIVYDAISAADIAIGLASSSRNQRLAQIATNLVVIAAERRVRLSYRHVYSHRGDALNELADSVARATAVGNVGPFDFEGELAKAEQRGSLQWWWRTVIPQGVLPPLQEDGSICLGNPGQGRRWTGQEHVPGIPQEVCDRQQAKVKAAQWDLRLTTYNANSVKHEVTRQFLDCMFSRAGVQIVGIQESRCFNEPRIKTKNYECYCSPCEAGSFGCQLWIRRGEPVATMQDGSRACFDVDHVVVLASRPRLLAAVVEAGTQKFACVVAHAPTSQASNSAIHEWWEELDAVLRRLPRNAVPVLFLDGNARFHEWEQGGVSQGLPKGRNAVELSELLREHDMDTCKGKDERGQRVVTWVAPGGQASMIDYIALPRNLANLAVTHGLPPGFADHVGLDHRPSTVSVAWKAEAACGDKPLEWDRKLMRTDWGRHRLMDIFASMPVVSWDVDVDTHLQQINEHVYAGLKQHFVRCPARPRQPHISEELWAAIRCRRTARRVALRGKDLRRRLWLSLLLDAWSGLVQGHRAGRSQGVCRKLQRARLVEARCCRVIKDCSRLVGVLSQRDAATYAKETMRTAKKGRLHWLWPCAQS